MSFIVVPLEIFHLQNFELDTRGSYPMRRGNGHGYDNNVKKVCYHHVFLFTCHVLTCCYGRKEKNLIEIDEG